MSTVSCCTPHLSQNTFVFALIAGTEQQSLSYFRPFGLVLFAKTRNTLGQLEKRNLHRNVICPCVYANKLIKYLTVESQSSLLQTSLFAASADMITSADMVKIANKQNQSHSYGNKNCFIICQCDLYHLQAQELGKNTG